LLDFGGVQAEGFFAEYVLAGLGGAEGPGDVEVVGEGVVDDIDGGVGEERFVGGVGGGDLKFLADSGGFVGVAGSEGGDLEAFAAGQSGQDFGAGEFGGAENAPA
jgi:hypothetical protein